MTKVIPNSRFEENILLKAERSHAVDVRLHALSVRITDWYVHHPDTTVLLEDSLKDALAGLDVLLVLRVPRTKPAHGQVTQVNGVRPFARLHFVHVAGISEVGVPVVSRGKLILVLCATHSKRLAEARDAQGNAVQALDGRPEAFTLIQLSFQTDGVYCALGDLMGYTNCD